MSRVITKRCVLCALPNLDCRLLLGMGPRPIIELSPQNPHGGVEVVHQLEPAWQFRKFHSVTSARRHGLCRGWQRVEPSPWWMSIRAICAQSVMVQAERTRTFVLLNS